MLRILLLATLAIVSCANPPPTAQSAAAPSEVEGVVGSPGPQPREDGHPRPATIAALESVGQGRGSWLRASLTGASGDRVRVGEEFAIELRSDRDAHLTAVHVDGEGNLTLLVPNETDTDGKIEAGKVRRFPPDGSFGVVLPIGPESVFAFATEKPLSPDELGLPKFVDGYATLDPMVGPAFGRCLQEHLDPSRERTAFARVDYLVAPAGGDLAYTRASVEEYFGTTTRSFSRPTLDLLIQFDSGSAELSKEARTQLDEAGKALAGAKLSDFTFQLNGHTDDVGADGYNQALSQRRAAAARSYLISKHQVDAEHLKAVGWGEGHPKMPGTNKVARDQNRRVELELASRGTRGSAPPFYQCGE